MQTVSPRRYIIAVAPSANAGIGDALRRAFSNPELSRPATSFQMLLERLDKTG